MTTEAVCERVRQIEGIDQSMMGQYSATIRKVSTACLHGNGVVRGRGLTEPSGFQANVNGRVLSQCNIDELKKEMNMNFGDWQLFRGTVRPVDQDLLIIDGQSENTGLLPVRRFWTCATSRVRCCMRKLPVSKAALWEVMLRQEGVRWLRPTPAPQMLHRCTAST